MLTLLANAAAKQFPERAEEFYRAKTILLCNTIFRARFVLAARKGETWSAYSWATGKTTLTRRNAAARAEGFEEMQVIEVGSAGLAQASEAIATYTADSATPAARLTQVVNLVTLKLVRADLIDAPAQLRSPNDVYAMLRPHFADVDRETFVVICLDTKNRVLAVNVAFTGTLDSCSITLREVYKAAVVVGAASIVVSHNHPSGDPTPSPEDVALTRSIVEAGRLLDIDLLDHIVLGNNAFVSLREKGLGFSR